MGVLPQDGARIIFAGTTPSSTLQSAVNYVWHKGAVIFAAGGNSSSSSPVCAAACDNVITVRATEPGDTLACFSDNGSWIAWRLPATTCSGRCRKSDCYVKACDVVGNAGSASESLVVPAAAARSTVPTVQIVGPLSGSTVTGMTSVLATPGGSVNVTQMCSFADGVLKKATDSDWPFLQPLQPHIQTAEPPASTSRCKSSLRSPFRRAAAGPGELNCLPQ